MRWNDGVVVDAMLPFGLCSTPKIFTALADGLEWIIGQRRGRIVEHYLNDLIVLVPPADQACMPMGLVRVDIRMQ